MDIIKKRYPSSFRLFFTSTVKTFFIVHLIWDYFYAFPGTRGPSMLPTLEVLGDQVLIDRWYRRGRGIQVGDLVSFNSVVEPGERVIKRVIGLEGDYVLKDTPQSGSDMMIQIPKGHCWLVGDNMDASRDSRMFGPAPMALIIGKVIYKIAPFSERKSLGRNMQPVNLN